ncbi:hypothetical protein MW887_000963 [Aspergillus wentii]|nr:hypothetical protein MW887_000963 [Aspergillus wentii]
MKIRPSLDQNGIYNVTRQLQETVWLAMNASNNPVILKSVNRFRFQNERDVLMHFQSKTPFIRPLVDEVVDPPTIVLKYLNDNLLNASISQRLTSTEIKHVSRRILEALRVLHKDRFVHTDIKPDNILVNHGQDERFTDVQLADFGSTVPSDSGYAKESDLIGTPIWRSPEAHLGIGWSTSTDIWSFGALLITLLYGDNFFLFKPGVSTDHEEYELKTLQRQCEFFGPFPMTYREICPPETLNILAYMMQSIPPERKRPFARITEKEISKEDKEFVVNIMKLDPRDRPSAAELLHKRWLS